MLHLLMQDHDNIVEVIFNVRVKFELVIPFHPDTIGARLQLESRWGSKISERVPCIKTLGSNESTPGNLCLTSVFVSRDKCAEKCRPTRRAKFCAAWPEKEEETESLVSDRYPS